MDSRGTACEVVDSNTPEDVEGRPPIRTRAGLRGGRGGIPDRLSL